MTDRELLELAAKAAGMRPGSWFDGYHDEGRETGDHWNPLTDDGDALRLAVRLGLVVYCDTDEAWCEWGDLDDDNEYPFRASAEPEYNGTGSVRRAIVRAAAAIGQSLAATSSGDSR